MVDLDGMVFNAPVARPGTLQKTRAGLEWIQGCICVIQVSVEWLGQNGRVAADEHDIVALEPPRVKLQRWLVLDQRRKVGNKQGKTHKHNWQHSLGHKAFHISPSASRKFFHLVNSQTGRVCDRLAINCALLDHLNEYFLQTGVRQTNVVDAKLRHAFLNLVKCVLVATTCVASVRD
ncbi:hypothetical protein BpHYR1_052716 [Brachionus plicatilis]|uniref:Uncharacterized protein n=1 Tax=Brachionus plicatilis TaxID=10195 RepID=A0A3M7SJZ2_BRAPC|nr:hypothetical protein BpHYR1_052716 [Brachionus plicatilis]